MSAGWPGTEAHVPAPGGECQSCILGLRLSYGLLAEAGNRGDQFIVTASWKGFGEVALDLKQQIQSASNLKGPAVTQGCSRDHSRSQPHGVGVGYVVLLPSGFLTCCCLLSSVLHLTGV